MKLPKALASHLALIQCPNTACDKTHRSLFLPEAALIKQSNSSFVALQIHTFQKFSLIQMASCQPIRGTYILMRSEALKNSSLSIPCQRILATRRPTVHLRSVVTKVNVIFHRFLLVGCSLRPRVVAVIYLVSTSIPRWSNRAWNSIL